MQETIYHMLTEMRQRLNVIELYFTLESFTELCSL